MTRERHVDASFEDSELLRIVREHSRRMREEHIILYAGASLVSHVQLGLIGPDLSAMPVMGPSGDKDQPGSDTVDELECLAADVACRAFGAAWADVRLPSCTIGNMATFSFFTRPGDLIMGPSAEHGGHLSQRRHGTPSILGLNVASLPFDVENQCLDASAARDEIMKRKPKLVMLGRSVILGPDDLGAAVAAARAVNAVTVYDASHVAGLIANQVFDNPFEAGIDVLTSSTYKTLRGPAGGMVLFRDAKVGRAFSRHLDATFLANQDASRLPPMISALRSCEPPSPYGRDVLWTANRLKDIFSRRGMQVLQRGKPARSHQIVVSIGAKHAARIAMKSLEAGGILVGGCVVPGRSGEFGLRFGSQVIASRPLDQERIRLIGDMTCDILDVARVRSEPLDRADPVCRSTRDAIRGLLAESDGSFLEEASRSSGIAGV